METQDRELTRPVTENTQPAPERARQLPSFRVGAVVAIAAALLFLGWLVLRDDDDSSSGSQGATSASVDDLRDFAGSAGHPVYWAGERDDRQYELTKTRDSRVYVRYLPEDVDVGDPRPNFLTIGTYPRATAFADLQRAARAKDAVTVKLERGGLMVFSRSKPTSVYFGYPGGKYQVEVYSPSADEARRLVLAGQVVPVG